MAIHSPTWLLCSTGFFIRPTLAPPLTAALYYLNAWNRLTTILSCRSDRPKWPERSKWTTFKVLTEISGILGRMESSLYPSLNFHNLCSLQIHHLHIFHNAPYLPQKFYINFSWDSCNTKEQMKKKKYSGLCVVVIFWSICWTHLLY